LEPYLLDYFMQEIAVILGVLISFGAGIFLWLESKQNKSDFKNLINKRRELSDDLLRLEFGVDDAEWPAQLKVIKRLAEILSFRHGKIRPKDKLSDISKTHRFSGDALLEFELIIVKNSLGNINTVDEFARKISKVEWANNLGP